VRDLVREFDHAGKPIATLCHGPWVLASSGLAAGRAMTSWPGVRDDLVNAGATWLDQKVVRDGNLLSSRGPQDIVPFVREMIQLYAGAPASNGALRRRQSDPQRDEPPTFAATAMRVMPNLSVSTMLGMALLSAGAYAVRRSMRGSAAGEPTR
jgi:protease I